MIKYTDLLKTFPKENLKGTPIIERNVTTLTQINTEILTFNLYSHSFFC